MLLLCMSRWVRWLSPWRLRFSNGDRRELADMKKTMQGIGVVGIHHLGFIATRHPGPNWLIQAGRGPRGRGPRPLNSDR